MKCFDKTGHITTKGTRCQQEIAADARGCIWYVRSPEERQALALKGGLASRLRQYLPADTPAPDFASPAAIVAWAQRMAQQVQTGRLEPRAAGACARLGELALAVHVAQTQARLVDALLKLEHGAAAVALLERLQSGLTEGRRRPLPGRPLPLGEGAS